MLYFVIYLIGILVMYIKLIFVKKTKPTIIVLLWPVFFIAIIVDLFAVWFNRLFRIKE